MDEQADSKTGAFSRRKFLEHTATAGGAAIIGAAATVGGATQQGSKATGNSAGVSPSAAAQLTGMMTEYPSGDIKIPAYLSRPKKKGAVPGAVLVIHEVFGL